MCCFIGYNLGQKAHKLHDLQEKKIIMSRDVIFHESLFPLKNVHEKLSTKNLIIPNIVNVQESHFDVNIKDSIPSDNYNSDNIDFINENEEFAEPHQ